MNEFLVMWQHIPEKITPYLFKIGNFQIKYYSLMYIIAFVIVYYLSYVRIKKDKIDIKMEIIEDLLFYCILGVILGGRLGYVIFYGFSYYVENPLEILLPFSFSNGIHYTGISGMSYHGGVIGVIVAGFIFCKKKKLNFWEIGDFIVPSIPLGYMFGRIGNFINGELYGRITTVKWGMYFPLDQSNMLRHPSQLYEAFFEGFVLFIILWSIRNKEIFKNTFIGLYIFGYGFVRFFLEFFREPDENLGFIIFNLSMGQILCLFMIIIGLGIIFYKKKISYLK